uniref:Ricin B-type lectin domain-containing protein n=1 Tax=Macrostomum lignano TaxID=282301 RepID=A0A1I8FTZ5_9PLAT
NSFLLPCALLVLSLFCLSLAAASLGPALARLAPTAQCVADDAYPRPPRHSRATARVNLERRTAGHPMAPGCGAARRRRNAPPCWGQLPASFLLHLSEPDSPLRLVMSTTESCRSQGSPMRFLPVNRCRTWRGPQLGEVTLFKLSSSELLPAVHHPSSAEDSQRPAVDHARNMDFGLFLGWNVTEQLFGFIAIMVARPLLPLRRLHRGAHAGSGRTSSSLSVNSRVSGKTQSLARSRRISLSNACMAKGQENASFLFSAKFDSCTEQADGVHGALMRVDDATLVAYRRQCPRPLRTLGLTSMTVL